MQGICTYTGDNVNTVTLVKDVGIINCFVLNTAVQCGFSEDVF